MLQKWLARELEQAQRGMYTLAREPEVAFHKEPDIRLFRAGMAPVTVEAKWAHKGQFNKLAHALSTNSWASTC